MLDGVWVNVVVMSWILKIICKLLICFMMIRFGKKIEKFLQYNKEVGVISEELIKYFWSN